MTALTKRDRDRAGALWLDQAGIPYMLAGSFASTLHGRPRSTQDVDVVIDPSESALRAFLCSR